MTTGHPDSSGVEVSDNTGAEQAGGMQGLQAPSLEVSAALQMGIGKD